LNNWQTLHYMLHKKGVYVLRQQFHLKKMCKPIFGFLHIVQPQEKLCSKILIGAQLRVLQCYRLKFNDTKTTTNWHNKCSDTDLRQWPANSRSIYNNWKGPIAFGTIHAQLPSSRPGSRRLQHAVRY